MKCTKTLTLLLGGVIVVLFVALGVPGAIGVFPPGISTGLPAVLLAVTLPILPLFAVASVVHTLREVLSLTSGGGRILAFVLIVLTGLVSAACYFVALVEWLDPDWLSLGLGWLVAPWFTCVAIVLACVAVQSGHLVRGAGVARTAVPVTK